MPTAQGHNDDVAAIRAYMQNLGYPPGLVIAQITASAAGTSHGLIVALMRVRGHTAKLAETLAAEALLPLSG